MVMSAAWKSGHDRNRCGLHCRRLTSSRQGAPDQLEIESPSGLWLIDDTFDLKPPWSSWSLPGHFLALSAADESSSQGGQHGDSTDVDLGQGREGERHVTPVSR